MPATDIGGVHGTANGRRELYWERPDDPSASSWLWLPVLLAALGFAWIAIYFVSHTELPIETLGNWNMAIGFLLIAAAVPALVVVLVLRFR